VNCSIIVDKRVFAGGGSDVAVFVPISFDIPIYASYHHVMTKIEFASVVEERPLDVGLDDVGSIGPISILLPLLKHFFYVLESEAHFNPVASVAVLPRFNNPSIILLDFGFILVIFDDFFGSFVIIPQKLKIFLIFKPILDMESQREIVKHLQIHLFVVIGHRIKQSLFIANHVVIYQVVVHL